MRLDEIDLNLLTVLRAVYETRHVTRAAEMLGISQPAVSHALKRLRAAFDDELFLRLGGEMLPTTLTAEVAPAVAAMLSVLERDVLDRKPFAPETLQHTFRIAATDFVESILAPGLAAHFAARSPGVRVAMMPVGANLPVRELELGHCDLAIAGFGKLPPTFHRQLLFCDTFASAVRKDHPRLRGAPTIDAFAAERHLLVAPSGELSGAVDRALAKHKKTRSVVAGTSGFMVAGWMTAESDAILTAPSRLLHMLTRYLPLHVFEPPIELEPIEVVSVWHARSDADPAHQWLREAVAATASASATTTTSGSGSGSAPAPKASASAPNRTARRARTRSR
ncbi:MAG: LysR family transcriptional regulator [Labilithrix sp.]